jgi:hypothetical protein
LEGGLPDPHPKQHRSQRYTLNIQQLAPDTAERYRRVVDLKKAGLTYDQIAAEVGYADRSGAKHALDAALERWGTDSVGSLRMVQNEQLDDLWRRVFAAIAQGDLTQIDRALKILKRRADLWGMDAPRQHEIAGPGGSALRTDVGDLLMSRLEELRERQGPLAEDLDVEPLMLADTNGIDPETVIEAFLGGDDADGDGYAGSGLDGP